MSCATRPPRIVVAAAVIERDGAFLLTRRPDGVHLEGYWEFPGGKCADGESIGACLARELREELDVATTVGEELLRTEHAYPEQVVELHFLRASIEGTPRAVLGQNIAWVRRDALATYRLPPADAELVLMLERDTTRP